MALRRLGAYFIDVMLILILSNILSVFLPNHNKIVSMGEESNEIMTEYIESVDKSPEEFEKISIKFNNFSYELNKLSVYSNLATIVLYFLYFIVFQSYNNGQTVGKRLLKIEVVGNDDEDVGFKQLLIRGLVIYPILFNLLDIMALFIFKQSLYESISVGLALIKYVLYLGSVVPILFGKRGLHDCLAKTCVIMVGSDIKEESNVSKWKKTADKEQEVKKYRVNHTSGKRKG